MALTSLAGAVAGRDRHIYPFWRGWSNNEASSIWAHYLLANTSNPPVNASTPAAGLSGEALTSPISIPFRNPVSGNTYFYEISIEPSSNDSLGIFDRLWQNSGIDVTATGAQTINSVALPARDRTGSINGENCVAFLEVWGADMTNASPITNITISYTNSAGTSGRVGTIPTYPATARNGTAVQFCLDTGDTGIKSIESLTLGTSFVSGGTLHLSICRPVVFLSRRLGAGGTGRSTEDIVTMGAPRLFDNSCLFGSAMPTGSSVTMGGRLTFTVA